MAKRITRPILSILVVSLGMVFPTQAADGPGVPPSDPSIFEFPNILEGERAALALAQSGNLAAAENILKNLIARFPGYISLNYRLAKLQAQQDDKDAALQSLRHALKNGLPDSVRPELDSAFAALHRDSRFLEIVAAARQRTSSVQPFGNRKSITATLVRGQAAMVTSTNTGWDPRAGMLRSLFRFLESDREKSIVMKSDGHPASRLNSWFKDGTAAGNVGDLYDNRDGGHSMLPRGLFPQMAQIVYDADAMKAGLHRGLNSKILFNAVTIGNASLAHTEGAFWRSLPRAALTDQVQVAALYQQYAANQIYIYPEHNDHDAKHGDLLPANTPYLLISQGSSGSDQPLLRAVAAILAAFHPEVKGFLVKHGLIAPTVQWIFRRSQTGIVRDDDYLSGRAHPSAFDGKSSNLDLMIEFARNLKAADVPPMVRMHVTKESRGQINVDTFFPDEGETLFDTPSAIARVIRSTAHEKRLVVDAGETTDPNGRPLTFRWSVLNGGASIRLLNDRGSIAEIVVPWRERQPRVWQRKLTSDRIDIGVFADNGKHISAPAFISIIFPGNEKRTYRSDKQIAEVRYNPGEYRDRYVDPLLFPMRNWQDAYLYDDDGHLLGWRRLRGGAATRFMPNGMRVIETDSFDRPTSAEKVRYEVVRRAEGRIEIVERPTGEIVTFAYSDNADVGSMTTDNVR